MNDLKRIWDKGGRTSIILFYVFEKIKTSIRRTGNSPLSSLYPFSTMKTSQHKTVSQAAEKFSKLFYEYYDKDRNKLKGFFMENAQLVWNGNPVSNLDNILKFLNNLPSSTIDVTCIDAQPVDESVTDKKTTMMVTVQGKIRFQNRPFACFHETFIMTENDDKKWKIVSDVFRSPDCST